MFDMYPYTLKSHIPQKEDKGGLTNKKILKSHIPQKEDKGGLTNKKICIFKEKHTASDFVR